MIFNVDQDGSQLWVKLCIMQNEYLPKFSIQVSESSSVARMREEKGESEKVNRGRERARDNGNNRKREKTQEEPKKGWPPSSAFVHLMEYWVPHRSFDICAKVFIQTLARAAVTASDLQCLSNFEVVIPFFLIFVILGANDFR